MSVRRLALVAFTSLSALIAGVLLLAPAALAEESCPNAASRQGPSGSLPDCRAYEQMTPVGKGDAVDLFPGKINALEGTNESGYAAEDGDRFLLTGTLSSFADGGTSGGNAYLFTRGSKGWTTTSLATSSAAAQSVSAKVFDPIGLSRVGIADSTGTLPSLLGPDPSEYQIDNLVGPPGGPYMTVSSLSGFSALEGTVELVGASSDLSRTFMESANHTLASGAQALDEGSRALYESVGEQTRLVNIKTDGSLVSACGAILGNGASAGIFSTPGNTHNAVSRDGSKVFFIAPDPEAAGAGCWNSNTTPQTNPPQLYMRLNSTTTVDIGAPEVGVTDLNGLQPDVYVGASTDGSKVFFVTRTQLTSDDTTHAPELYEYNTEAPEGKRLVRISHGETGTAEGNVDFVGAISSDGSAVYFAAFGALTSGASQFNEGLGRFGPVNLYRYDAVTGKTTLIAIINADDYALTFGEQGRWYQHPGVLPEGEGRPQQLALDAVANWYTTGNGQYLVFGTNRSLTGFDTTKATGVRCENLYPGAAPNECVELYRYDAITNVTVCVSCAGGAPIDNAEFARSAFNGAAGLPPRPISEDGNYVFFDTANALTPQAIPGKIHVYEWHNGKISLISSLDDPSNAYFLESSVSGSDVFFGTHAQLAEQDTDNSGDLYDARMDGGFVGLVPSQCTGTGCQGVPAAPPIFATPASVTFEGVGNFSGGSTPTVEPRTKKLTEAQKLAKALKVCRADRNRSKRKLCEAHAKKRYGGAHKSTKSNRRGK